jgi:hypothetical protein
MYILTNQPTVRARKQDSRKEVCVCELVHNAQSTWATATTRAERGNDGVRAIRGETIV